MSQSIKFDNNTFVDASGVRDSNRSDSQENINAIVPVDYVATTRAWYGTTLVFNDIPVAPSSMFELIARDATASGKSVHVYFTTRSVGIVTYENVGTVNATLSYSNGTLTVTLPSDGYWSYSLRLLPSHY